MPPELRPGVWCIEGSASNVYLVVDHAASADDTDAVRVDGETGALVLLDAGTPSDAATIRKEIGAAGFSNRFGRWSEEYLHRCSKAIVAEARKHGCTHIAFEDLDQIRDRISDEKKF